MILVVTNMYPSHRNPSDGTFVLNCVSSLEGRQRSTKTVHLRRRGKSKLIDYIRFYISAFRAAVSTSFSAVYVHYVSHSSPPVLLAKLIRPSIKLVAHVHGSDVLRERGVPGWQFWVKKVIATVTLRVCTKVVCPSNYYKQRVLVDVYGIDPEKIMVSPSGGVDTTKFTPLVHSGCTGSDLRIGYVGRLTEDKGILEFLEVCNFLRRTSTSFSALVVGDGPSRMEVERLVPRFNGQLRYSPPVPQNQLPQIYQSFDLLIFPTKRITESLGLVGLEAMACGVPVVASDIAGPAEYIQNSVNGFLVQPGCAESIVGAIERFLALNLEERREMRAAARATAMAYDSTEVANELSALFGTLDG